jgi:sortase A
MPALIATALLVAVVAALSVYGPLIRQGAAVAGSRHLAAPRATDPVGRLARWMRDRPAARMVLSALSIGLLVGAVAMIGYPFYTNLVQGRLQGQLDHQLASPELREAYLARSIGEGESLTRILIPAIGVDVVVVEGTSDSALRAGAGHYPETPLPCEIGNVAIAGHRTTYGRPFHHLDRLVPGDEITLVTPIGRCTYEVSGDPFVVRPDAVEVVANTPDEARLTLTTFHPKGSAAERLIATATLVRSDLVSGDPVSTGTA